MQVKLINTGGATKRNQDIKLLNDELRTLNLNNENDRIRKLQIQNNLADNYFISTISDETYQYKLINIDTTPIDTTPLVTVMFYKKMNFLIVLVIKILLKLLQILVSLKLTYKIYKIIIILMLIQMHHILLCKIIYNDHILLDKILKWN